MAFTRSGVAPGYLNNDFHPMLLLSRAAAEAPGLELGMVALMPLYHPVEAPEQIATLDVISEGRFILVPALGRMERFLI